MKKLVTLLLVLLMMLSAVPVMSFAEEDAQPKPIQEQWEKDRPGKKAKKEENEKKEPIQKGDEKQENDPDKKGDKKEENGPKKDKDQKEENAQNKHHNDAKHFAIGYGHDAKHHWIQYACGCKFDVKPHDRPKKHGSAYCICGYRIKSNEDTKDHDKGPHKHETKKNTSSNGHNSAKHTSTGYGYNAKYHWIQYACGCQFNVESHVDPKSADNNVCICGYQFSDNADLVTLWVAGCPPIKNFNKNTTEYKLNAYTYKDVKEIKISTNTFHPQTTVELPEDLTLKEGENKFEVKVIAENQKDTKVYTLIITKEAKK